MKKIFLFYLLLLAFLITGCDNRSYQEGKLINVTFSTDYFIIEEGHKASVYEYMLFSYNKKGYTSPLGHYYRKQECGCNTRGDCCHECYSPDGSNESCKLCLEECNNNLPVPTIPSEKLKEISKDNITVFAKYDKKDNILYDIVSPEITKICLSIFNNSDCYRLGAFQREVESYVKRGLIGCLDVPAEFTTAKISCFKILAEQKRDITICENILFVDEKYDCEDRVLLQIAKDKKDVNVCYSLHNKAHNSGADQRSCIIEIAKELKKPGICKTASFNKDYEIYDCYYEVALRLNDATYCEYIPSDYSESKRNYCYLDIAIATKNKEICNAINSPYHLKPLCLEYVSNAEKVDFFCNGDDYYCLFFMKHTINEI